MNKTISLLIIASILLIPSVTFAEVPEPFREFVTHGEFNEISNAFERVALVFSDSNFEHFITVFFLASVFAWLAVAIVGFRMVGAVPQMVLMQSGIYILFGVLMYMVFIQPKTEIAVYDSTTNQHMIIADVPDGIALIAGTQNMINEALVDMIWTSSDPDSYLANAGGDIYNILGHVFDEKKFIPSIDDSSAQLLNRSIQKYWVDCSVYAINGPTGGFDLNTLHDGSVTVIDVLSALQNDAQQTRTYIGGDSSGQRATCTEAFNLIELELNSLTESGSGMKFWEERCGAAGYYDQASATGTPAVEVCKNKTIDFLATQVSALSDSMNLVRQYVVASALQGYIKKSDIISHANYKIMTGATGEAASASNWVPVIKGVVFAAYLGLMPFLLMLLPTMLSFRVILFIVGLFVFILCWGVCDAILHSNAMDRSIAMMRVIFDGANNLSLLDIWLMCDESMKSLVLFGKLRWSSMMLAAVVSAVIAKFAGVAIAHFAGQMNFSGLSSQASNEIYDPDQRSSDLRSLPQAAPTEAVHNQYGATAMARKYMMDQESGIVSASKINEYAGGGGKAVEQMSDIQQMKHRLGTGDLEGYQRLVKEMLHKPEDISFGNTYTTGLRTIGATRSAVDLGSNAYAYGAAMNSDVQNLQAQKTFLANDIASHGYDFGYAEQQAGQILANRGGRIIDEYGGETKVNPRLQNSFNASGPVTIRPTTAEQKENVANFLNSARDSHLSGKDIPDTLSMNMAYNDGKLSIPDVSGVEGFNTTSYHDSGTDVYGNGVRFESGAMIDALDHHDFVGSDFDIVGHKDAAIAEFTRSVSTMYNEDQRSMIDNQTGINVGLGVNAGVSGSLKTGYNMSKANVISENQISAHMHESLSNTTDNIEAQRVMQESYDYYKNYMGRTTDQISVRNLEDGLQTVKDSISSTLNGNSSSDSSTND